MNENDIYIFPFLLQTLNKEDETDKEKKPLWRKPQKKKGGKKGGGGGGGQKQKSKNKKKDNKCLDDASAATSGDTAQGSNSTVGDTNVISFIKAALAKEKVAMKLYTGCWEIY